MYETTQIIEQVPDIKYLIKEFRNERFTYRSSRGSISQRILQRIKK
jgi:hypothetical protein